VTAAQKRKDVVTPALTWTQKGMRQQLKAIWRTDVRCTPIIGCMDGDIIEE
jgi:hypothetical protein